MNRRKNIVSKVILSAVITLAFVLPGATMIAHLDKNTRDLGWVSQNSGTTQQLNAVSFTTTDIGTVVGNGGTILRTTDAGATWVPQTCGLSVNLLDVSFYNDTIGVAVGHEGTIIATTNGGDTWNIAQTGWMTSYYGTHMVTSTLGFAVGVNTIFQPLVTKTNNGWNSFHHVVFYLEQGGSYHEATLRGVHFVNASIGFATASVWNGEGAIVRTTNSGGSWSTIYWTSTALYDVHFPTTTTGYAAGNDFNIHKTTDGGDTWTVLSCSQKIHDIWFVSENIGTAVGDIGVILRTEDGGVTWSSQDSGTSLDLNDVTFLDEHAGFIVGDNGVILHTTTGGWTNRPPEIPVAPDGPTEGKTDVEYEFTASTTDPEEDDIFYWFDWGDETNSGWLGPYASGAIVTATHTWTTAGIFDIQVKAKDSEELESDWSEPHTILIETTPLLEILDIQGGLGRILVTIKNTGSIDVTNVTWTISLDGGFMLLGKETTGRVPVLNTTMTTEIQSKFIIGIGKPLVTVRLEVDGSTFEMTKTASVLLFFVTIN